MPREFTVLQVKNTLADVHSQTSASSRWKTCSRGHRTLIWGGEDIVSLSKEITKWAKQLAELEIKGGAVEGQVVDAKGSLI